MKILTAAAVLALLSGCAPDIAALAQDKNQVCIEWTWVYGSGKYNRNHGCDMNTVAPPVQ